MRLYTLSKSDNTKYSKLGLTLVGPYDCGYELKVSALGTVAEETYNKYMEGASANATKEFIPVALKNIKKTIVAENDGVFCNISALTFNSYPQSYGPTNVSPSFEYLVLSLFDRV